MSSKFAAHFENGKCTICHIISDKTSVRNTYIASISEERGWNIIGDETFFEITSITIHDDDSYTIYGTLVE